MVDLRLHRREVKTALRRRDLVDSYFVGKFGMSPYQACAHGCAYCDGRAERYFIEGDFDRDIVIRSNIATVLERDLRGQRERGIVFIGSGVSDAYQPPEAEENLMRSCARILADRALPATVLTKSHLALRDLDVWSEVNRKAGFVFMVSLMTLDDDMRRVFEPHASTIDERLDALSAFKAQGCVTGVAAMPFLPGLSDGDEQIRALAEGLSAVGVDFVLPGGLTLRPGRQKQFFLETLRSFRPDLLRLYERLYAEDRPSGAPLSPYGEGVHRRAAAVFQDAGFPIRMPHAIYRGRLPVYDEIYVLMQHMVDLYVARGRSVRPLRDAQSRYTEWLLARKKVFNRRRSLRPGAIEWELKDMARTGGLGELLANAKLGEFLRAVLLEGQIFDYRRLELVCADSQ
jgi:DNA repair photolyase